MSLMDIMINVALFFGIFYGGILITSFITKKLKKEDAKNKAPEVEEQKKPQT